MLSTHATNTIAITSPITQISKASIVPHPSGSAETIVKSKVIRGLRNTAGIVLVIAGIVLGPVPIIPGFVFVIIGLGLIDLPIKRRAHVWLRHRFNLYRRVALTLARHKRRRRLLRAAARTQQ